MRFISRQRNAGLHGVRTPGYMGAECRIAIDIRRTQAGTAGITGGLLKFTGGWTIFMLTL